MKSDTHPTHDILLHKLRNQSWLMCGKCRATLTTSQLDWTFERNLTKLSEPCYAE